MILSFFKDFEGNDPLIRLKEEPEDSSTRKVPCLSDLSEDGEWKIFKTISHVLFKAHKLILLCCVEVVH